MVRTLIMGAVLGLVGGIIFGVFYFGAGQITTPMAYVHDVSGLVLGIMVALIVYLYKRGPVRK